MLGVHFVPAGNGMHHTNAMKEKGLEWVDSLTTRPLHPREAWLSLAIELYPAMAYGIASVVLAPKKLVNMMHGLYYKALPLLGINRCITREWRLLGERYQGLGMANFACDCLAAKIYLVQSH